MSKRSEEWLQQWNEKHHPERLRQKPKENEERNQSKEKPQPKK